MGSTVQTLSHRWSGHKCDFKRGYGCRSGVLIGKYGEDACWLEVLEEVSDDALLEKRERHWIDNTEGAVNLIIPGRTAAEYRIEHVEDAKIASRAHYENNKEKRKGQIKAWAKAHPDSIREATKKCARKRRSADREGYNASMRAYRASMTPEQHEAEKASKRVSAMSPEKREEINAKARDRRLAAKLKAPPSV